MNNKKGFTLVELLAVIVIIGIIAVITVPILMNVIDNTQKGAIKDSVYGVEKAASLYYAQNYQAGVIGVYDLNAKQIKYKGNIDKGLVNYEENGKITILIYAGKYCGYKYHDNAVEIGKVVNENCIIDNQKIEESELKKVKNDIIWKTYGEYGLKYIGHRGLSDVVPENTKEAFEYVSEKGLGAIATDPRLTKDGKLVCSHDEAIDRLTSQTGNVRDYTLEELKNMTYDTVSGSYTFASFDEYLKVIKDNPNLIAFVQIKEHDSNQIPMILEKIEEYGLSNRTVIMSYFLEALKKTNKLNPNIKLEYIIEKETGKELVDTIKRKVDNLVNNNITNCILYPAYEDTYFITEQGLEGIRYTKEKGYELAFGVVGEINTYTFQKMSSLGFSYVHIKKDTGHEYEDKPTLVENGGTISFDTTHTIETIKYAFYGNNKFYPFSWAGFVQTGRNHIVNGINGYVNVSTPSNPFELNYNGWYDILITYKKTGDSRTYAMQYFTEITSKATYKEPEFKIEGEKLNIQSGGLPITKIHYNYIGPSEVSLSGYTWTTFISNGKKYTEVNGTEGYKLLKNLDFSNYNVTVTEDGWYVLFVTLSDGSQKFYTVQK